MAIDIFSVQPHQVSKDLRGYSVAIYGPPKVGKTTIASKFPNNLLLAFEKGYAALPGVMALPVNRWTEFHQIIKQLNSDEAKAKYETIIIDTADIAWMLCEAYIASKHEKSDIAEIPYGQGYKQSEKEFDLQLRKIVQLGYGLVLISHAEDKPIKDESGNEYSKIRPTLTTQARKVVLRLADIVGYVHLIPAASMEEEEKTTLFLRGTTRFEAGSRFKYTPKSIPFNYNELVNAISQAIDIESQESGVSTTENRNNLYQEAPPLNFNDVINRFNSLTNAIMEIDEKFSDNIIAIIETRLGKGKKVSQASIEQVDLIDEINFDLEELINSFKI